MSAASTGDMLVGLSSLPLAVGVISMFNRRGALAEWGGSAGALRGVRIRGTAFLVGLLMLAAGLTLGLSDDVPTWSVIVGGLALAALIAFVAYRPATVDEEPGAVHRHRAPTIRLRPAARKRWLAAFTCSALASVVLVVGAVV